MHIRHHVVFSPDVVHARWRLGWAALWCCAVGFAATFGLTSCSDDDATREPATVGMDFSASAFYAAPFPSDHRLVDGRVRLEGLPGDLDNDLAQKILGLLDGRADGFGTTSGIFLQTSAAVDAQSLPTLTSSTEAAASVYLISTEPDADDYLRRYPIEVEYHAQTSPYGADSLLSALPLQGVPLQPRQTYALVITDAVRDTMGQPLGRSASMAALATGAPVPGLDGAARETYDRAIAALTADGALDRTVALAAFTTWDPTRGMSALAEHARSEHRPNVVEPLALVETFPSMCVYQGVLEFTTYQSGVPPYEEEGGIIEFEDGVPIPMAEERARFFVTIPRHVAMPDAGWPVAAMIRTGGGGDRPLIDRGVRRVAGSPAEPGTGPAVQFTAAGFAGVTFDGPHGGLRNIDDADEQFLVYNVQNPPGLIDNLRQSALEYALLPDVLAALELHVGDCEGANPVSARFDTDQLALMGHSMGASIAPLVLAVEPRWGAGIFSGGGGSFVENIIYKESPIVVKPFMELLLGYSSQGVSIYEHDPFLNLLQWAGEPADPPVYGEAVTAHGTHILMVQGIVDTYILPSIANAMSLSHGLDRAGEALDVDHPDLVGIFEPLDTLLPFVGRAPVSYPVRGNRGEVTAVVIQHEEDNVEDGHEVMFQTEGPKHQYQCFLQSWRETGMPSVPPPGPRTESCE
ncbi:MAG: hypothetical protein AAGA56_09420 [Myxococcota bacterium]